jgi:hypothetical protein
LNGLYTALAPNSLRATAGYAILVVCLWIPVCDLAFILPELYFVRETKIVPREKNTVKVKEAPRKITILQIRGNHMGKRR